MLCRRAWLHSDVCECHTGPRRAVLWLLAVFPRDQLLLCSPIWARDWGKRLHQLLHAGEGIFHQLHALFSCHHTEKVFWHTGYRVTFSPFCPRCNDWWKHEVTWHCSLLPDWSPAAPVSSEALPALAEQDGEGKEVCITPFCILHCWIQGREEVFPEQMRLQKHWLQIRSIVRVLWNLSFCWKALQTGGSASSRGPVWVSI